MVESRTRSLLLQLENDVQPNFCCLLHAHHKHTHAHQTHAHVCKNTQASSLDACLLALCHCAFFVCSSSSFSAALHFAPFSISNAPGHSDARHAPLRTRTRSPRFRPALQRLPAACPLAAVCACDLGVVGCRPQVWAVPARLHGRRHAARLHPARLHQEPLLPGRRVPRPARRQLQVELRQRRCTEKQQQQHGWTVFQNWTGFGRS